MSTVAISPERAREDVVRLVHRGAGVREFALGAAGILARAVPFDWVCVLTMDPATLMPTGGMVENGVPTAAYPRLKEIEFGGEDFTALRSLALSERHAATLSEATGGVLNRSERHREILGPNGFGDELRAALVDGNATWGGLDRRAGRERVGSVGGECRREPGADRGGRHGARRRDRPRARTGRVRALAGRARLDALRRARRTGRRDDRARAPA